MSPSLHLWKENSTKKSLFSFFNRTFVLNFITCCRHLKLSQLKLDERKEIKVSLHKRWSVAHFFSNFSNLSFLTPLQFFYITYYKKPKNRNAFAFHRKFFSVTSSYLVTLQLIFFLPKVIKDFKHWKTFSW